MINPNGGTEPRTDYVRRAIGEQIGMAADTMWRELVTAPEDWHFGWRLVGLASIASDLGVPCCWSILLDAVRWTTQPYDVAHRAIERRDRTVCRRHADCPLVRDGSLYRIAPGASLGWARMALNG